MSLTDEMIAIIAQKYAELCHKDYQEVYTDLLNACHTYVHKRARSVALKKKIKGLF
ncbi:MAG: hypothetical protein GQ583_05285 [Methyloprofundus sp.]|nr:hypothetical protein [Methyloprofundus sp.]